MKNAWEIRWKNVKYGKNQPREKTINPSCLNVLKATIFFPSVSIKPETEAKNIVIRPNKQRKDRTFFLSNLFKYLKIKKIPAVTRVLEWTSALTGVGALIAIGNQLLNGSWADFVKAPKIKIKTIKGFLQRLILNLNKK